MGFASDLLPAPLPAFGALTAVGTVSDAPGSPELLRPLLDRELDELAELVVDLLALLDRTEHRVVAGLEGCLDESHCLLSRTGLRLADDFRGALASFQLERLVD